jgi:RNA polymerase primary sigma factor
MIMELPSSRVSAIQKMARQSISLQAPIGNSEDGSLMEDILADIESEDPVQNIARKVVREKLHELLGTLSEREQQIIIMRFGLMGFKTMTLIEVSQHFNLTRERIRQLEIKIIEKLRSPAKLKFFDGYFHTH